MMTGSRANEEAATVGDDAESAAVTPTESSLDRLGRKFESLKECNPSTAANTAALFVNFVAAHGGSKTYAGVLDR